MSLRVPVPCDHLRCKTNHACRTLRPLDLNNKATKMYAFHQALTPALHNKILQLSPMPTTLAGLVEKAWEFDKNWRTFTNPTRALKRFSNVRIQETSGEDSKINATTQRCMSFGCGRGHGHSHRKLSAEERERRIKHHLCLYCAKSGHRAIECTAPPNCRPRNPQFTNQQGSPSVCQIDAIPEEGMENLTLEESGVNIASANYFEPLVKINVDDHLSFMDTLYVEDGVHNITHAKNSKSKSSQNHP